VSVLKQRAEMDDGKPNLWTARTMLDVARIVSDAMREIEERDAAWLKSSNLSFNASFIFGGRLGVQSDCAVERPRSRLT